MESTARRPRPRARFFAAGVATLMLLSMLPFAGVALAAPTIDTTTTITSDTPDPTTAGVAYTVHATVDATTGTEAITGTMTISDGTDHCHDTTPTGGTGGEAATYSCSLTSTTAGSKTLTASYPGNSSYGASSGTAAHTVNAGTFTKLQLLVPGETADPGTASGKTGTPSAQTAGTAFSVTVNAVDATWHVVSSTHIVGITSSDSGATLPPNAHLVAGTKTFSVTLATAGSRTVTATDATDAAMDANTSPSITVSAGAFSKLQVLVPGETAAPGTASGKTGTPSTEGAGAPFTIIVNAVDANWNVASSTHTVGITSTDAAATLPANAALVAGTKTFSVTLNTVGSKTVTATDSTDATKTASTSAAITVVSPAASGSGTMTVSPTSVVAGSTGNSLVFTFTSPASSGFSAGSYVTLTVPSGWTAPTTSNTAVANVTGTLCSPSRSVSGSGPWTITITQTCAAGNSFSLTYSSVTAPATVGTAAFTAGSHNGAAGTATALATSPSVTVSAGAFSKLQVLVPGETAAPGTALGKTGTPSGQTAGAPFSVTVNAVDANWNVVSSTHTVAITSSDVAATLPVNAALVAGTRTFSVTLNTAGSKTVTATDITDATKTPSTSAAITVVTPAAIQLVRSTGMVTYGGSVGFSIQFGANGANRSFFLEQQTVGVPWATVATAITNAGGFATLSYTPTRTGYYRVRFAGAADLGAAYSSVVLVGVRQTATLFPTHTGVMTIAKGRSITFRSTVRPARLDLAVSRVTFRFYQKVAGAWVLKYERHVATNAAGTARTTFRFGVGGNWYVRAFADRTPYNAVSRLTQREVFLVR